MKITRIVKRLGRTIQTKQFNTIRLDAEFEATVDENDDLDKVDQELFDKASKALGDDIQRIRERRTQK